MATILDLSEQCGVSVSTVSKALNGYSDISEKTREIIIKAANEMGYFPNANARALKLKKTYNIGVLFTTYTNAGLRNDYFAHILSALKEELALNGYDITFIEHHIGRRKMTYLEHCQYRRFDGVCIVCANYKDEEVIRLVDSGLPVVTIDYSFLKSCSIISDNYNGMKHLMKYILRQGHTEIALIHGAKNYVTQSRIDGFLDAVKEKNIKIPEEFIVESMYHSPLKAEEQSNKLLQLPSKPTCIIAPDDYSAMGVISAIRKQGLQAVKDVSIAGYDGLDVPQLAGIKITSVRQERDKIGSEAAQNLIRMIENPNEQTRDTLYIEQSIIVGNSIRKLRV